MSFRNVLKELRKERNFTQKEVANSCNLTPTCICQLESGSRSPTGTTLIALADFFQVSVDYLLGRTDDLGGVAISPSPALDLTENEKKLLDGFRRLSKATQNMILRFVSSAEESEKRA